MSDTNGQHDDIFFLCFVRDGEAWFSTIGPSGMWGDDWNDTPYEHNAGEPRPWRPSLEQPPYSLMRLMFQEDPRFQSRLILTPCHDDKGEKMLNSKYSVQDINAGKVPWLRCAGEKIYAGASLAEVIEFMDRYNARYWRMQA